MIFYRKIGYLYSKSCHNPTHPTLNDARRAPMTSAGWIGAAGKVGRGPCFEARRQLVF